MDIDGQFTKIVEESDTIRKNLPEKQQKLKEMKDKVDGLRQEVSKHDRPELREKIKHIESEIKKAIHMRGTFQEKYKTL